MFNYHFIAGIIVGIAFTCTTLAFIIAIVEHYQNKVKCVNVKIWDSYKKGIDADCSRYLMEGRG